MMIERRRPVGREHLPLGKLSMVVFGPGTGEAIVLRFPDGTCGVVDACMAGDINPVLELVQELVGGNERKVRFVAMTHPHDDHIRGMDQLIDGLRPLEVWYAGRELQRTLRSLLHELGVRGSQPDRFPEAEPPSSVLNKVVKKIVAATVSRPRSPRPDARPVSLVRNLRPLEIRAGEHPLYISCVLPTEDSALLALKRGRPRKFKDEASAVERGDPRVNDMSAAMIVQWGEARILLGGDVEAGSEIRGWGAVDPDEMGSFQVVKVAHHGSGGSFSVRHWAAWKPRLAILTPFEAGSGTMPPQPDGVRAIKQYAEAVALTHPVRWQGGIPGVAALLPGSTVARAHRPDPHAAVSVWLNADGTIGGYEMHGSARVL